MTEKTEQEQIDDLLGLDLGAIPGWLAPMASLYTLELRRHQRFLGVRGSVLEIGVYKGKYLSVLYRASEPDGAEVIGIDSFVGSRNPQAHEIEVLRNVTQVCGDCRRLRIVVADSQTLSQGELLSLLGQKASLVSIDGGHTFEIVLKDLENCVPLLVEGGIIALDDFFNQGTPEVTEALYAFWQTSESANLVPFAHCYNKLFLTTRSHHHTYLSAAYCFLKEHQELSPCRRTLKRHQENQRLGYIPRLHGWEIVPFF